MELELFAKLEAIKDELGGTNKTGNPWKKRDIIVKTVDAKFPKNICISCWGDLADSVSKYALGSTLKIKFDVESREFNSKWYTDVKAWRVELSNESGNSNSNSNSNSYNQAAPAYTNQSSPSEMPAASQGNDDLPF